MRIIAPISFLLVSILAVSAPGQTEQPLTKRDYDAFYTEVVLRASNKDKESWLASYDAITGFVERVRKEVEALPNTVQLQLAEAVHNNGYWKHMQARTLDPKDPFIGAALKGSPEELAQVLTPAGLTAYEGRFSGGKGYKFSLEIVSDRAAFFALEGKQIEHPETLAATTNVVNANALAFQDLLVEAGRFASPEKRVQTILQNQLNAIASAVSLMGGSKRRSDAEMDYATAVIWRYTGHYSGKDGWEKEPLIAIPYKNLPASEKEKDRPVWKAVRAAISGK